jgi:hypothetical protein
MLSFIAEVVAEMRPGASDPIPLERVISRIEELGGSWQCMPRREARFRRERRSTWWDEELAAPPEGTEYVLEVSLMRNVLKVWSAWRNGAAPSIPQACEAVLHYAERDAYLPVPGPES